MEVHSPNGRRPLPVNPDLIRGLLTRRLCTDIVAPELMDVETTEICTYQLFLAPTAGVNNPESGYAANHLESPRASLPPARAGFIGRLVQRKQTG